MSDMHFREPNQVKWSGVRPAHNGTQIRVGEEIVALLWTPVYEVPAGETGMITHISLSHGINAAALFYIAIYDATPALEQIIYRGFHILNWPETKCNFNYWPPMELPTGYSIQFYQNVNTSMVAQINGWSE